jgi:type II secretion system protein J
MPGRPAARIRVEAVTGGRNKARDMRGFTLLELLLAVVIFGVVLAAINTVYYSALRLRNKTTQSIEAALPIQHTVQTLQRDIEGLAAPGGVLSGELQSRPLDEGMNLDSRWERVGPEFFTVTGQIDHTSPWAGIQKVAYYLAQSTNQTEGRDLMRAVSRNLLPVDVDEAVADRLLTGVQTMMFSYYDGNQWQESWDSTTEDPPLPTAIRVQLQMTPDTNAISLPAPLELIVPVTVRADTNATSQTEGGEA